MNGSFILKLFFLTNISQTIVKLILVALEISQHKIKAKIQRRLKP